MPDASPALESAEQKWKVGANAEYQKVVAIVMNLATASLVLPLVFLRSFMGLKDGQALSPQLMWPAIVSWVMLLLAVGFGLAFSMASAKFVKVVYGGHESRSENFFERARDCFGGAMAACFVVGLVFMLIFFYDSGTLKCS